MLRCAKAVSKEMLKLSMERKAPSWTDFRNGKASEFKLIKGAANVIAPKTLSSSMMTTCLLHTNSKCHKRDLKLKSLAVT